MRGSRERLGAGLNRAWRIIGTGVSFALFGIGGIVIGLVIYPLTRLVSPRPDSLRRRMQYLIHLSFRGFVGFMNQLRLLRYSIHGESKLLRPNQLIVANHPTLIDVVMLISRIPRTNCVVKASHWHNPVMAGPVRAAGYIPNTESAILVERCHAALDDGQSLVIFPEGTRSTPGVRPKLQRGTANIALRSGIAILPVRIRCTPSTLTKGLPWYSVPARRFHMELEVGEPIDPAPYLRDHPTVNRAARALTRDLEAVLWPEAKADLVNPA